MIAQYIEHMAQVDVSIKVKIMIVQIQSQYGYMLTYWKAWTVKQKAIERIYGG